MNTQGTNTLLRLVTAFGAAGFIMAGAIEAHAPQAAQERTFPIPLSLLEEHAELHTALETASRLPGDTGTAARKVLAIITPHFQQEQRRVFPLLRVLPMLAAGQVEPGMADLLPVADRLRADFDGYLREHLDLAGALDELSTAAWRENHEEYAFLAERIRRHDRMDREVLYPAAQLAGECLRQRLPPTATASLR